MGKLTPCLLRDLTADGKITIRKEGFKDYRLSEDEMNSKNFTINIVPMSFDLYFPETSIYNINNTDVQGPVYISKIKSGNYNINLDNNKITFKESSSIFLPLEIGLGTACGISFSVLGACIGISEYNKYYANNSNGLLDRDHYTRATKDADTAKYVSIGISSVLAAALIGVIIGDAVSKKYSKSRNYNIANKLSQEQDVSFYDNALKYLSVGDIGKSTQILETIISLYPDSEFIPRTYYQLGQNYYINKDYDKALANWEIFIRDFPIRDYYDYVIKNIADIYYLKNDLVYARNLMDRIVYSENIYNKELINSFNARLDYEIYVKTKNTENYDSSEREYLALIDEFNNSERLDIYFSQLLRLYNYTSSADKISELKNKAAKLTGIDESIKRMILGIFD